MQTLIVGGALVNKDIQEFGQVCLCRVVQAYGLTETCAGATTQFENETNTGEVGSVIECVEIRLVDWPEGNYRVTDKPNPRGEIWIGGANVTLGYYKMPEKTAEDYHVLNGIRYFATGDIGEFTENGNLKIIDRKKDLVKLSGGEYVSLGKVEAVIKLLPFVDNCCLVAKHNRDFSVCLVSPNVKKVEEMLTRHEKKEEKENSEAKKGRVYIAMERRRSFELLSDFVVLLANDKSLNEKLNKDLTEHCLSHGLQRFEVPARIKFVSEIWLPDSGLVTDSLKLKRKEIENFYAEVIENLYKA